jgi:hypothetical protein
LAGWEEVFDFFQHFRVVGRELFVVFVGDDALFVDAEDLLGWDFDSEIGNGVGLPVPETSYDRLFCIRENLVDAGQQFDLELIRGLLDHLPREGLEIAIRTHQQGSWGQLHAI